MEALGLFFVYALTAISLENAVFTRALGIGRQVFIGTPHKILAHCVILTSITTVGSALSYGVNYLVYDRQTTIMLRSLIYLLCITAVYFAVILVMKFIPRLGQMSGSLAVAAFNCAALGTMVLSPRTQNSLAATVGFGFGTGVGYTMALFLIYSGRRRLELIELPRAFKGMPITLLYIGIVSLAIYGLIGHQLPT